MSASEIYRYLKIFINYELFLTNGSKDDLQPHNKRVVWFLPKYQMNQAFSPVHLDTIWIDPLHPGI